MGFPSDRFGSAVVSDLSRFDIDPAYIPLFPLSLTPIMVSIGKEKKIPYVNEDNKIVVEEVVEIKFTFDHRIIDGKESVGFLVSIKNLLENPSKLILGV